MRAGAAVILCVLLLFSGCGKSNTQLDDALSLRKKISECNGCSFRADITADYGEKIYTFAMDCTADSEGNLSFTVAEPSTIAGITGRISAAGGEITFDDKVLAFQTMADGQITPVTAPWILIHTLQSGYLRDCSPVESGMLISIDDSYAEDALHLKIIAKEQAPVSAEIFWQGRRVLTLTVDNFTYL